MIASTAVSAAGAGFAAISAHNQAEYQANVAKANVANITQQQSDAITANTQDMKNLYLRQSQLKGQQIAAMSSNGIDTSFGSALQVQQESAQQTSDDAMTLARNQFAGMRGFDIQRSNAEAQESAAQSQASGALVKGVFDMGSTIIGGATQYSKYQAKMAGSFG